MSHGFHGKLLDNQRVYYTRTRILIHYPNSYDILMHIILMYIIHYDILSQLYHTNSYYITFFAGGFNPSEK